MNHFKITLDNIQHIQHLEYDIDLSKNTLHCIVGKNGVGKTTLIKAIENFKDATALDKLSRLNIVNTSSSLKFVIDDKHITFTPTEDDGRYVLDTTEDIAKELKEDIFTELPLPKGKRFDLFQKLGGSVGDTIKAQFSLSVYDDEPTELIELFRSVYGDDRFSTLKQIDVGGEKYYIKPLNEENYLREDDFSSGEYMIVQIYKLMQKKCKLIVIDELDISLDSSAQVKLLGVLRKLARSYESNLVFTTHSLAIMKSMPDSLYYMETTHTTTTIERKSYNYIKSLLFQFEGYDKIILTEDKMLVGYVNYLLRDEQKLFCKYKIIHIAGHSQTVDLMERNAQMNFLGTEGVISLLDGDQRGTVIYQERDDIIFIPFESVEKDLYQSYIDGGLDAIIDGRDIDINSINLANKLKKKASALYHSIIDRRYMSDEDIFNFVNDGYKEDVEALKAKLVVFLT